MFTIAATLALSATLLANDPVRQQKLQQAIDLIESKGDIAHAMPLLEDAAKSADRVIAARALLRIADCYRSQGHAQAKSVYERLVREYGDQKEIAAMAMARLATSGVFTRRTLHRLRGRRHRHIQTA